MKKIDFGFNDDNRLNSSFSRISPYNGEYIEIVSCNGFNFLITRIIDSYNGLNGNIDVREIAQDYYADGSYVNYANQASNGLCRKFEQLLNTDRLRHELNSGKTPLTILREAGFPVSLSAINNVASDSKYVSSIVTSIRPELFQRLKDSKKYNAGKSMYYLVQENQILYDKIAQLKEEIARLEREKHKGR